MNTMLQFYNAAMNNSPIEGYFVKNAKHELLIEKDRTRSNIHSSILEFYKEHP